MMPQIVFLAPHPDVIKTAQVVFQDDHADIGIALGLLSEGVSAAAALAAQGAEIIIARGGTAAAIRTSSLPVTVVEVPITGFDIIRAIEKAKLQGRRIGVVTFPSMFQEIGSLSSLLNLDIRVYPLADEKDAEQKVQQAVAEGADVILGGYVTLLVANKLQCPCVLLDNSNDSLLLAASEAKRVAHARNLEKAKAGLLRAIFDYAYEGIVAVDSAGCITLFNHIAEKITGIDGSKMGGEVLARIWAGIRLDDVLRTGMDDLGQIISVNGTDILCNKVALRVNDIITGVVVTFQEVGLIQQMESRIRQRSAAVGHVAAFSFDDIDKTSPALVDIIQIAKEYAVTSSSIMIVGETGTGKEVFAQSIHNYSARKQGPFVAINCAALPANILESELFGYVGGAFTGANPKGKNGLFEAAHTGTIFLDEIGEMEYTTQGKLLRVLQERKIMPVGSDKIIPVDVRVIAASNQNLKQCVKENKFRADLYYRLNVLQLRLPPLRERLEDIPVLATHFLYEQAGIIKRMVKLTPTAIKVLQQYAWPGNVRELKNVMERVIAVHKQGHIDAASIKLLLEDSYDQQEPCGAAEQLYDEKEEIRKALQLTKGKYIEAAKILNISRSTLWRKLRQYGFK